MKFEGSLFSPLKFSSLKKDITWFVWRQKFMVSCDSHVSATHVRDARFSADPGHPKESAGMSLFDPRLPTLRFASTGGTAYLVVGVAPVEEDVHHGQLVDVSVALELLPDARPDRRDGVRDQVHGLDLGRLETHIVSAGRSGFRRRRLAGCPDCCRRRGRETYCPEPISIRRKHSPLRIGPVRRCCVSVAGRVAYSHGSELTLPHGDGELSGCDRHGGRGCGCRSVGSKSVSLTLESRRLVLDEPMPEARTTPARDACVGGD